MISSQHQCLAKQWWPCSSKYYHKGTWYTLTFLYLLFCGHNKNQLFHYFGLLNELWHHKDLPKKNGLRGGWNIWQYFSPFLGKLFQLVGFIVPIPKVALKWLWNSGVINNSNFQKYEFSLLPDILFWQVLLKIQNHIDQELQQALHIQGSLRGVCGNFISYIKNQQIVILPRNQ